MKAAVIESPGKIAVKEVPKPTPGPGEVLLKVEACALCGTDQRVLRGEKAVSVPIIGHEITATAVELGAGVSPLHMGKRIAVQTVIGCGKCPPCLRHQENLCENTFKAIGYAWNGGFAEYMVMPKEGVDQGCLIPLPPGLSHAEGTLLEPLSCCISGLRCMPLEEMDRVVIFGAGIIGVLNGLVAKARGVKEVILVNRSAGKLNLIRKLGLPFEHFVNMADQDPVDWIKKHTGGRGADAVVVSASAKNLIPIGMKMLRGGGHLSIFAGMNKNEPTEPIDLNLIHYSELHIHGANSSVRKDYLEALVLIEKGAVRADQLVTHTFPLDRFNEAMATQRDGDAGSLKIVVTP